MSAEKIIRHQARQKLKANGFVKALFGLGILAVFYMVFDGVAYLETILSDVIEADKTLDFILRVSCRSVAIIVFAMLLPALMGYIKMFYTENDEYDMSDVVYFFKDFKTYFKSIAYIFSFLLRMIVPAVLSFLPVFTFIALKTYLFDESINDTLYSVTLVVLTLLSSVVLLIYSTKYFLSLKLFCENQELKLKYYFETSKSLMSGHSKEVVKLCLSFTPWILLSFTVLPLLYTIPYFLQATCISGKWLYEISRNGLENELL